MRRRGGFGLGWLLFALTFGFVFVPIAGFLDAVFQVSSRVGFDISKGSKRSYGFCPSDFVE